MEKQQKYKFIELSLGKKIMSNAFFGVKKSLISAKNGSLIEKYYKRKTIEKINQKIEDQNNIIDGINSDINSLEQNINENENRITQMSNNAFDSEFLEESGSILKQQESLLKQNVSMDKQISKLNDKKDIEEGYLSKLESIRDEKEETLNSTSLSDTAPNSVSEISNINTETEYENEGGRVGTSIFDQIPESSFPNEENIDDYDPAGGRTNLEVTQEDKSDKITIDQIKKMLDTYAKQEQSESQLSQENRELKARNEELQNENNRLSEENEAMEKEAEDILKQAEQKIKQANASIKAVKNINIALQNKISKQNSELIELRRENEDLKVAKADLTNELKTVQTQFKGLANVISNNTEKIDDNSNIQQQLGGRQYLKTEDKKG